MTEAEQIFKGPMSEVAPNDTEYPPLYVCKPTDKLAEALAKAQADIMGAHKDTNNPFFNSKYADLKSCWDACRDPLTRNGLSVVQLPSIKRNGNAPCVAVKTMLLHTSGQSIDCELEMPIGKVDAHGVGSAITYARRYSLCSMVGITPEDDDGNAAVTGKSEPPKKS